MSGLVAMGMENEKLECGLEYNYIRIVPAIIHLESRLPVYN